MCAENTVEKTQKKKEEKAGSSGNLSGLTVMFNPLKASDPKSKAIRTAAWLGVVVKVTVRFRSFDSKIISWYLFLNRILLKNYEKEKLLSDSLCFHRC